MSQSSDRDIVHASFSVSTDVFKRDSTGTLQRNASRRQFDSLPGLFGREIIQQDDVGTGLNDAEEFIEVMDFDFDFYQMAEVSASLRYGVSRGCVKCEVVVLDENTIEQACSMVHASTACHCVFIQNPQTRRGFARINDARSSPVTLIDVLTSPCRNSG